jgi:hypothetical protein
VTVIVSAMAGGLTLMAGLIVWSHAGSAGKIPTPDQLRMVNYLTTIAMVAAVAAIAASEVLWRVILRRSSRELGARTQTAFLARLACREGAALLGMTAAYIAAGSGVLRVYPAYWVNMVPYALFLGFLATHWPSDDKLAAEAREILS